MSANRLFLASSRKNTTTVEKPPLLSPKSAFNSTSPTRLERTKLQKGGNLSGNLSAIQFSELRPYDNTDGLDLEDDVDEDGEDCGEIGKSETAKEMSAMDFLLSRGTLRPISPNPEPVYVFLFVKCVLCFVFCVLCFVFCVLCFVFCVLCFVFCVLCFVFCVLLIHFFLKHNMIFTLSTSPPPSPSFTWRDFIRQPSNVGDRIKLKKTKSTKEVLTKTENSTLDSFDIKYDRLGSIRAASLDKLFEVSFSLFSFLFLIFSHFPIFTT
jgi:hypothetical protein